MQLLSTQWSCSQVNIQLSYIGVPYRLTFRMICRTISCKHMWAKNGNLKVKMTTAILLSNRLQLSTTSAYLSVASIRWRETWPRLRFGVWRLHWNHAFVVIDHSILGASCHASVDYVRFWNWNCRTAWSTITLDLWSPKSQVHKPVNYGQPDVCLSNWYQQQWRTEMSNDTGLYRLVFLLVPGDPGNWKNLGGN